MENVIANIIINLNGELTLKRQGRFHPQEYDFWVITFKPLYMLLKGSNSYINVFFLILAFDFPNGKQQHVIVIWI